MGRKGFTIWKYVKKIDDKKVKCTLCGHQFNGGGSRIKAHLQGITGRGVKICTQSIQFHQLESVNASTKRAKTNETASANGSSRRAKTIEPASVNGSNKRAKTIASSSEQGLPNLGSYNRLNENVQVEEEKGDGLTSQVDEVKKETKPEELISFNVPKEGPCQVGPFTISHPVDSDDWKLIEYVFDASLSPSEVIVSFSHSFIDRSEFSTLRPGGLLDGMVINIVVENLTNVERKKQNKCLNWYLPISFSSYALENLSYLRELVEKQHMKENYMSNLVDCHKIFIPIHIGQNSQGHFYLYVVDTREEVVEIWDSLPSFVDKTEKEERAKKILSALDNIFLNDIKTNYPEGWAFAKFEVEEAKDIPTQLNSYDCGMFVIKFMKSAAAMRDSTFKLQSDEERLTLAWDLLKDDMNTIRIKLLEEAKRHYQQDKEDQHAKGCRASVLRFIPEKLQCKEPGGFTTLDQLSSYNKLDQSMQLLKENLKDLTSQENHMRKKLEKLGSLTGKKCKSEVENWLKIVEQRKNQVLGMVNGVRILAEEVSKLVRENLPESLSLNDHDFSDDPSETTEITTISANEELKSIHDNLECKQCFIYSAFYPEQREISRQELINYLIDEGLIDGKSLEAQFTEGHIMLDELESNSLLEGGSFDLEEHHRKFEDIDGDGDEDDKQLKEGFIDPKVKWVKLSGASRALAMSIINESSGFMVEAGLQLSHIPHERKWADMEKVSLMCNLIKEIPWGTKLECPKLSTLILQQNPLERIPDTFFSCMPALQVLDLSYTNIKRLPKSISDLTLLTSLLLRSCRKLEYVPPLGKLQGLMRLDLSLTAITDVPKGLDKLVSLRWLNFFRTRLLHMNPGLLIPNLTNLEFLVLDCNSSGFMKVKVEDLKNLKKLETFAGNLYDAHNFNDYVKTMQAMDCRLKNYFLQLGTGDPWNPTFGKIVSFVNCNIMTRGLGLVLPVDVQQLYLAACQRWSCVCDVFSFNIASSLKYCEIFECDKFENLFCLSDACSFCNSLHNLESLRLSCLQNLRFLWKEKEAVAPALPPSSDTLSRLRQLKIVDCEMKVVFTPGLLSNLQNLEKIHVECCASVNEIFSVTHTKEMGEGSSGGNHAGNNDNDSGVTTLFLPKLVSLVVWDLPQLISVCRWTMECHLLQEFVIWICPKLETLPRIVPWFEIQVIP